MITGITCTTMGRGFFASLALGFNIHTGEADTDRYPYPSLCLSFEHLPIETRGMYDIRRFDEPWIDVEIPAYRNTEEDAGYAAEWLDRYCESIQAHLDAGERPRPVREHDQIPGMAQMTQDDSGE